MRHQSLCAQIPLGRRNSISNSKLSGEQQISSIWDLGGLTWQELPRRVWGGISKNDLVNRAYELAYNFLLAVFRLLLFLVALLGIFASEGSKLQSNLFFYFQQGLPPVAYQLVVSTLKEITQNSGGANSLSARNTSQGGRTQCEGTGIISNWSPPVLPF